MDIFSTDHLASVADKLWELVVIFVPKFVAAILIIAVAAFIARRAASGMSRLMSRAGHIDATFRYVVAEIIRYSILILAIVAALEQVGVKATSLFAVIGAAGIAIGLALQGTLSNIAAGLMILWLRPFHIGDYVEVNNVPGLAGTIEQTGLFACQLRTFDGLFLFTPNALLWNVALRNFTRNTGRLITLTITVPHQIEATGARKALAEIAANDRRVAQTPAPIVFVERVTGDGTILTLRIWATSATFGDLQRDLPSIIQEKLTVLAPQGAPPVQITRVVPPDTDPSRLVDSAAS